MSNERAQWDGNFAFLMAMIGSAVGLGNIWRFPYIFYTNGSGSFMIPYIIAIVVLGLSFLILEYALGFKYKTSILNILRKVKDKFQILGWLVLCIIFLICSYYVCIVGWDLIYLVLSFVKGWGADPNAFFSNSVLHASDLTSSMLSVVPVVLVSTFVVWLTTWYISHRDLNDGVSKFSKIAVPLLGILDVVIVVFALTLPGAGVGLTQMFSPSWDALLDTNIWLAAFGQVMFSLSLGMAIAMTYASYLPKKANLTKNIVTVICANSGFEVFNAVGIFSILGFMAMTTALPFSEVITDGTGLAFIAFPEVFNLMGVGGNILGPIFFLCIFIAGLTSIIALVEPMSSSLSDKFGFSRPKSVTIVCGIGFLVSLLFTSQYGSTILTIFDAFLNNCALVACIILECLVFGWFFDMDSLKEIVNRNTLFKVGNWWKLLIKIILPIILFILLVSGIVSTVLTGDTITLIVEAILVVVLIVAPCVLYYLTKVFGVERRHAN